MRALWYTYTYSSTRGISKPESKSEEKDGEGQARELFIGVFLQLHELRHHFIVGAKFVNKLARTSCKIGYVESGLVGTGVVTNSYSCCQ